MKILARCLATIALLGTIVPPLLFLLRQLAEGPMKATMLVAALLWFATAPFIMKTSDA